KILKKEAERGALVLVSTHNLAHVTDLCTRVLLMEKSEIIKDLSNENSVAEKTLSEYFNI
ncbi:MAG: ABC transporter ATP-binding protein, partial [Paludibacteraceae bacterium]|nr:ABC transporter ATP-binding protein [Paludibacteraceae bacterium]